MPDYGARIADRAIGTVSRKLHNAYQNAEKELREKLAEFDRKYAIKDAKKREMLQAGQITENQYKEWLRGQVFTRTQIEKHAEQIAQTMRQYNKQAVRVVRENQLDVFAENYNYEAFKCEAAINSGKKLDAEKETGISFDIYNTQAVAKLVRRNPELLPKWEIDKEKDYTWNYHKVRNTIKQGIIQGKSIPQITKTLCKHLATDNEKRMMLFARTGITQAQNAGRIQQMEDAQEDGIEVLKQWLATLDKRTRDAHRHLDGDEAPVDKPFKSDLGDIMYPGDPTANPANVFNCRCTLISVYPKYRTKQPDTRRAYREYTDEEGKKHRVSYITSDPAAYEAWKNGKAAKRGKPKVEPPVQMTPIERIKEIIANHTGDWTTDQLISLGKEFSSHIETTAKQREQENLERAKAINQNNKVLMDKAEELEDRIIELKKQNREDEALALRKERDRCYEEIDNGRNEWFKLMQQNCRMKNELVLEMLKGIRPVGGIDKDNVKTFADLSYYRTQVKKTRERTIEAMNYYPRAWLDISANDRHTLRPHWTTTRAYYSWGEIRFRDRLATNVHELGHRMEHVIPAIRKAEEEFYERRTKGEPLQWLGQGYAKTERTRFDHFIEPYIGKDYGGVAFELVSMGFETVMTDYQKFDKDPEMRDWILGILAGM